MKQIRLKDKIEIIATCDDCPCFNGDIEMCNIILEHFTPMVSNFTKHKYYNSISIFCPLEDKE